MFLDINVYVDNLILLESSSIFGFMYVGKKKRCENILKIIWWGKKKDDEILFWGGKMVLWKKKMW